MSSTTIKIHSDIRVEIDQFRERKNEVMMKF